MLAFEFFSFLEAFTCSVSPLASVVVSLTIMASSVCDLLMMAGVFVVVLLESCWVAPVGGRPRRTEFLPEKSDGAADAALGHVGGLGFNLIHEEALLGCSGYTEAAEAIRDFGSISHEVSSDAHRWNTDLIAVNC